MTQTTHTDTAQHFIARADAFAAVLDGAGGRWDAPTPCEGWTVRDVVAHAIDSERDFLTRQGLDVGDAPDLVDPAVAWRAHAATVAAVLAQDGVAERSTTGYFGRTTIARHDGGLLRLGPRRARLRRRPGHRPGLVGQRRRRPPPCTPPPTGGATRSTPRGSAPTRSPSPTTRPPPTGSSPASAATRGGDRPAEVSCGPPGPLRLAWCRDPQLGGPGRPGAGAPVPRPATATSPDMLDRGRPGPVPDRALALPRPGGPLPGRDARRGQRGVRGRRRSCAAAPSAAPCTPPPPSSTPRSVPRPVSASARRGSASWGSSGSALEELWADTEAFAADWRSVDELQAHLHAWLLAHEGRDEVTGQPVRPLPGLRSRRAGPPPGQRRLGRAGRAGLPHPAPGRRRDSGRRRPAPPALPRAGVAARPGVVVRARAARRRRRPARRARPRSARPVPTAGPTSTCRARRAPRGPRGGAAAAGVRRPHVRLRPVGPRAVRRRPRTCAGSGPGPTAWCCRRCSSTAGSPATGAPPARPAARPLEVVWFAGTRRPRKAELDVPVAALEAGLGIAVTDVTLTREQV